MPGTNEDWSPKTREDWVDLFADGHLKATSVMQEAEAKAAAAKAEEDAKAGKGGGSDDKTGEEKPSFRDRILGF